MIRYSLTSPRSTANGGGQRLRGAWHDRFVDRNNSWADEAARRLHSRLRQWQPADAALASVRAHNPSFGLNDCFIEATIVDRLYQTNVNDLARTADRLHAVLSADRSEELLGGMLTTGAAAIFPVAPHSKLAPENSLTAYDVAAGATLLGEDQIKSIRQSASLMRPNFYGAALKLFQERHNLPFTDLMHSHILDPLKQQLSPEGRHAVEPCAGD
jgi:hypothetical protein